MMSKAPKHLCTGSSGSCYRMAMNESRWSKHCKAVRLEPWPLSLERLAACLLAFRVQVSKAAMPSDQIGLRPA